MWRIVFLQTWLVLGGPAAVPSTAQDTPTTEAEEPFGIQRAELVLKLRQGQVAEAQEWVIMERLISAQMAREKQAGGSSTRRLEIHQQARAEAEAFLAYRIATRKAAELELEQAKRRAAVGSPEEDIDQARARMDAAIDVAEARAAAWEAQLTGVELLVKSEQATLQNLMKFFESGTVTPLAITQAEFRVRQSEAARDRVIARQDIAKLDLGQARRNRVRLEESRSSGSSGNSTASDALTRRVSALELEVRRLEDEAEFVTRRLQRRLEADQKIVDVPMKVL